MPIKKTTFKRVYDEEHFVAEEWFNDQDLIIYSKRIEEGHHSELRISYNEVGLKLREELWEDAVSANRIEWIYQGEGGNYEQRTYFGAELYERERGEFFPDGFVIRTFQEGEEVARKVHKGDAKTFEEQHIAYGELVARHVQTWHAGDRQARREIFDGVGNRLGHTMYQSDRRDRLIAEREYRAGVGLIRQSTFTYTGKQLTREETEDRDAGTAYTLRYTYDERGNCLKTETLNGTGQLIGFHSWRYDGQDRCVEEVVYSVGNNDAMMGGGTNKVHDTFVHVYQ